MADEKKSPPRRRPMFELPIYESGYTSIPAFWIDELMPYATGIPASFWKYMMVLWKDIMGPNCETNGYTTDKTMTQFHMTKETAMQWSAALSVSGLFTVHYGVRYRANEPGIPTQFTYRKESTVEEWKCFITALRDTILTDKRSHFKAKREGVEGFRIDLSFAVDDERERHGLKRCYDKWRDELVKEGKLVVVAGNGDRVEYEYNRPRTNRSRLLVGGD
jgi:hypothetical protein